MIISMGCGRALDDPAGKDVASIRPIRDEIERRVLELLDDLRIPVQS